MKKVFVIACFVVLFFVLVLAGLCYRSMEGFPVDRNRLGEVQVGMSMKDVRRLLGEPERVDRQAGYESWRYTKPFMWTMVNVLFSAESVVAEVAVDR